MSNGMDPRTLGCLYLEPRMNGTGTHTFLRLDNRTVIAANHFTVLPIPPTVIDVVNVWAGRNKMHTSKEPIFTFHDRDITGEVADDILSDMVSLATGTKSCSGTDRADTSADTISPCFGRRIPSNSRAIGDSG